jgi:sugar phosphate isomerase/epimerase
MTQLDCAAKAKELGFDAIEYTDIFGRTYDDQVAYAKKIKEAADGAGIEIGSYVVSAALYKDTAEERKAEIEKVKRKLDIASILGAKIFRHDVLYATGKVGESRSFGLMLPYVADAAREISEYGKSLGIKTCTENHSFIAQDSYRMEQLFNAVNHDNYGLLIDIGNFVCADEDSLQAVSRLASCAVHVHVKDFIIRDKPFSENGYFETRGCNYVCGAILGEGDIPVKKCLAILKRAGYEGDLVIEYEANHECIAGISKDLEILKNYLKELNWN